MYPDIDRIPLHFRLADLVDHKTGLQDRSAASFFLAKPFLAFVDIGSVYTFVFVTLYKLAKFLFLVFCCLRKNEFCVTCRAAAELGEEFCGQPAAGGTEGVYRP